MAGLQRVLSQEWLFYLWLPIALGLFMGATQAGRTTEWPLLLRVSYFITICCVDWWIVDLGCRLCQGLLRPWRPSLWLILLLGSSLAAIVAVRPANWLIVQFWHGFLPPDIPRQALPALSFSGQFDELIAGLAPWLLANYAFFHLGNMPRYGFTPPAPARQSGSQAELPPAKPDGATILRKVRPDRRGELLALNAQGHYLRVITTAGEDLILFRFGDAVAEMSEDAGVQVHRSWWVSQTAIDACESVSSKKLRLGSGLSIPVSRTYQRALEQRIAD